MEYLLTRSVEALLLPPGGPMLLIALGLLLWRGRMGRALAGLGLALLYLSSIGATTHRLWRVLDVPSPPDLTRLDAGAIVVLGAARVPNAPEYGADTISASGLERIRHAAWLQKKTGLPILVSGGSASGLDDVSEAQIMAEVLRDEFSARVPWLEGRSRNTYENAQRSAAILKARGIDRIALVTHAGHMPRAAEAFRAAGLEVIPAPTGYFATERGRTYVVLRWLPGALALYRNRQILHELLGRVWYRWRYG